MSAKIAERIMHAYPVASQNANARAVFEVCAATSHFDGGFLGEACFRQAEVSHSFDNVKPAWELTG